MKNRQERLARLKHKLRQKKENGQDAVVWQLDKEQLEYIENLGYIVMPYLYVITTKQIKSINDVKSKLILDIHYAWKRGERKLYKNLTKSQIKLLDWYEVKYQCLKYKIFLK